MKRIDEIFEIRKGHGLALYRCKKAKDGINFVSCGSKNNGVVARIEPLGWKDPMPANAISVALGGSVCSSFYQSKPFYTSKDVACLYPKQLLTIEQMHWYACVIECNKYRFNFGRKVNGRLNDLLSPI